MLMRKSQSSFLIKAIFIVIASVLFLYVIQQFASFRGDVEKQKEESEFKTSVLNTLQKLVSDETCLAYVTGQAQKPILSKDKIDAFSQNFQSFEPDCAKAVNFDYAIRIVQIPYNFTLYPGEKKVLGELTLSNEFSSHPFYGSTDRVPFFDCNFNPKDHPELCKNTELDHVVCQGCSEKPRENCPYPSSTGGKSWLPGVCCIYYSCPRDACKSVETKPGVGDCGGGCIVSKDCDIKRCQWYPYHGACGMTYDYTLVPTGEEVFVNITENIWEFSLAFGQSSFSPPKARKGEVQLSLPVTIKYNETFSTEGIIYIFAVSGELEEISSVLEDTCQKISSGVEIDFSKSFHFSSQLSYNPSDTELCMGNSCKLFVCPYGLEFDEIEREGDYILKFSFDPLLNSIIVRK